MTITQAMMERAKKFEGRVAHMYLDTAGKVTVGTGHMLSSGAAAAKLAFTLVPGGGVATTAQIKAEHALMLQQAVGKPASYYKQFRTMEMSASGIDQLLVDDLGVSENDLLSIFSTYETFPTSAKEALMDMAFNLGKPGLLKFPALIQACKTAQWATAAGECHRIGVPDERNNEIRELFETLVPISEATARAELYSLREQVADLASRRPEVELRAAALMKDVVSALVDGAEAGRVEPRLLFPDGLQVIELNVSTGDTSVSIRVSGSTEAKSGPQSVAMRTLPRAPESCREAFQVAASGDLTLGDMVPNTSEAAASGSIKKKVKRTDPEFKTLVSNMNKDIVFKDEEHTGADRMMTVRLRDALDKLATATTAEWSGVKLRVTEAWDEDNEHAGQSLHYEGRAADLTTDPIDNAKLGRLGRLAVDAGFDWVWYENAAHIHVSVKA